MKLQGTILGLRGTHADDRVFAVGEERSVLAEERLAADGIWALDVRDQPEWVIAQLSGSRLVGVAVRPPDSHVMRVLGTVQLRLAFEPVVTGAVVWLDPVELQGFPEHLLWALRTHFGGTVDLHVAEAPVVGSSLDLDVQPGAYRLSGGRFAIRPTVLDTEGTILLVRATNVSTGQQLEASEVGEVFLELRSDTNLRLSFGPGQ